MNSIWRCPHCSLVLQLRGRTYACENNHCFDLSKEGYINLLPANKKSSQAPGDTKEMLQQRRLFLEAGYYEALSNELLDVINGKISESGLEQANILDCGSGEGYFTGRLYSDEVDRANAVENKIIGVDISKIGVQMAAKRYPTCDFAVASNFSLPVLDSGVDILVRNFAPSDDGELNRVLKPNGILVVVIPGQKHLQQLRALLYEKVDDLQSVPEFSGFELIDQRDLTLNLDIAEPSMVEALFTMTPFYWKLKKEFNVPERFEDTAQFSVLVYRKG